MQSDNDDINPWIQLSIDYANQRSYLDDLFHIYPIIPEGIREINEDSWGEVERVFEKRDNIALLKHLLKFDLFPIKDSYVAYLKRDKYALERNPKTAARLSGRLYDMGLDKIYDCCSEPKETNRQIAPLFRRWIRKKTLGIEPLRLEEFTKEQGDAILDGSNAQMQQFASEHLNYKRDKGLDFVARFNGKYVIGEAKFLTDYGGHQNAQFNDAMETVRTEGVKAITIAILDGVLYIKRDSKMYKAITTEYKHENIMSALVLRDFLYQL